MDSRVAVSNELPQLRAAIVRRLLVWALLNVSLGALLFVMASTPSRASGGGRLLLGLAIQAMAWGIVNAAIALGGAWMERRSAARRDATRTPLFPGRTAPRASAAGGTEDISRDARRLRRLLLVNTGLDVLYVAAGVGVVLLLGATSLLWRGHGWGIVLQGTFLFLFDLIHAQAVPPGVTLQPLEAFRGPEHLPFALRGGRPAALLVHGFPGTPAEMRALGESLHQAGWTVQGVLLPGFGPELATLGQRRHEDWLAAVEDGLERLRQDHAPLLLVGYSMGAALATAAAARQSLDGLILLAPFAWQDPPLQRWFGWLLRPFLPRYFQPFRLFDLSNPQARGLVANLMPGLNLDDGRVQEELRQVHVPLSLFDQVRKAGQAALRSAPRVRVPTFVVAGKRDPVVTAERMRPLLKRLPTGLRYLEVDAEHDVTNAANAHWPVLEAAVQEFAASIVWSSRRG